MLSREELARIATGEISVATALAALAADSAPPPPPRSRKKYQKVLIKRSGGRRFNAGRKPSLSRESVDPLVELCRLWREAVDAGNSRQAAALEKSMIDLQASEARCRIVQRERIPADVVRARRILLDDTIRTPRYIDVDSLI